MVPLLDRLCFAVFLVGLLRLGRRSDRERRVFRGHGVEASCHGPLPAPVTSPALSLASSGVRSLCPFRTLSPVSIRDSRNWSNSKAILPSHTVAIHAAESSQSQNGGEAARRRQAGEAACPERKPKTWYQQYRRRGRQSRPIGGADRHKVGLTRLEYQ
jgi:hypothetical protein